MKKLHLLFLTTLVFTFNLTYSQGFQDNFDSYNAGFQLACQNSVDWTTWNLTPCDPVTDAYVSDTYAHSGANSFVVVSANDVVHPIANSTFIEVYTIYFFNYIPSGHSGYFSTLALFNGNNSEWGLEVYFNIDSTASINAGGINAATFTWIPDTWVSNVIYLDICPVHDVATYEYNGEVIYQWQWTLGANGTPISKQIGGSDFYGATYDDEMYVDDYSVSEYVPVELTSFTAAQNPQGQVVLNWSTATENNNKGFDVERKIDDGQFQKIAFVEGAGTTTEPHSYALIDNNLSSGNYTYRLKQINFNGSFEYSKEIKINLIVPEVFSLLQNFPNPFNPSTLIKYSIPKDGMVKLTVYNTLGQKVAKLVNGEIKAGNHQVNFNASKLSSGVYYYRIEAGDFVSTKKMILLK